MRQGLWLGVDAGSTDVKAYLFDANAHIVAAARARLKTRFPQPGWVENDAMEIVSSTVGVIHAVLSDPMRQGAPVLAMGLSGPGESVLAWTPDGRALSSVISWQCRRSIGICQRWAAEGLGAPVRQRTGLPIDPYFSASKMAWLLEYGPGLRETAMMGRLRLSTVDSFILHHLAGGRCPYVTDVSTASRTQLLNLKRCGWDSFVLGAFDLPREFLPDLVVNAQVVGHLDRDLFGESIPIAALMVDQQAALYGHHCLEAGSAKVSYGTGAFVLANVGTSPIFLDGLLTSIGWWLPPQAPVYVLDGGVLTAGSAVDWLVQIGLLKAAEDAAGAAAVAQDEGGPVMVPALSGLGAPHHVPGARGLIAGISRSTTREDIVRAALKGVAMRVEDVVASLDHAGIHLRALRADGGPTENSVLMQLQADVSGLPVRVSAVPDKAALGVAQLAAHALGEAGPRPLVEAGAVYTPQADDSWRHTERLRWQKALELCGTWTF